MEAMRIPTRWRVAPSSSGAGMLDRSGTSTLLFIITHFTQRAGAGADSNRPTRLGAMHDFGAIGSLRDETKGNEARCIHVRQSDETLAGRIDPVATGRRRDARLLAMREQPGDFAIDVESRNAGHGRVDRQQPADSCCFVISLEH